MIRIILSLAIIIVSTCTFADDQVKSQQQTAVTQESSKKNESPQPSLYDSVKSGWNQFIDFLAGPTSNSKQ